MELGRIDPLEDDLDPLGAMGPEQLRIPVRGADKHVETRQLLVQPLQIGVLEDAAAHGFGAAQATRPEQPVS